MESVVRIDGEDEVEQIIGRAEFNLCDYGTEDYTTIPLTLQKSLFPASIELDVRGVDKSLMQLSL